MGSLFSLIPTKLFSYLFRIKTRVKFRKFNISFIYIFLKTLKRKYILIHRIFSKYIQNNIVFNYLYTKSNTFISVAKSAKSLLLRSLGMIGFRKKKKKLQTHPNYLLGCDFINLFKKLYFRSYYKRLIISIKGFRRFLKASVSHLKKHLGQVRKSFNTKTKGYKKFFYRKIRNMKICFRKGRLYRMNFAQRKLEANTKRERIKAIRQLLRVSFVRYLGSVPFGGQNFGKKNIFDRYIHKVIY